MPLKRAAAIRHVHFEDLGCFAPVLKNAGYELGYHDSGIAPLPGQALAQADLLVVLGGPVGAYEDHSYPFLRDELAILEARLDAGRPTVGICLGAQLIARALGSRVYPAGTKEIGWGPVALSDAGREGPLRHLEGQDLLHWHGDTFDLPEGCTLLASTEICRNQAFSRGSNLLALQFHPEVTAAGFEPWLIGHACELAGAGIDPAVLRGQAARLAPPLEQHAQRLMSDWLDALD